MKNSSKRGVRGRRQNGIGIDTKAARAKLAVRTHSFRAKAVAFLPPGVRSRLRTMSGYAAQLQRRQLDEWGHPREAIVVEGWSTPLVGYSPRNVMDGLLAEPAAISEAPANEGGGMDAEPPAVAGTATRLRCLFVCSVFDVGGVGEVVAFLATRLREHGIEPAILNAVPHPAADGVPQGRLGRRMLDQGIEVVEVDEATGRPWIGRYGPDVVYAHGSPDWVLRYAVTKSIPYVDALHGMHSLFGTDWRAEQERARSISKIVAVSELVRTQYRSGNPDYEPNDIVAIPNAVEDWRFRPVDRSAVRASLGLSDEYVFLSLARHCLQKNTYGLVAAFAELARVRSDIHLVLAGRNDDDRYYRHVMRLIETLPSRDRIHVRDHFPEPRVLLAASDGFVLDSFFEGWSLASMESLFAGVPVVLSDVGGAQEQVGGDPSRGFVVSNPLGDPLIVEWKTMAPMRYAQQPNRAELVEAMDKLVVGRDDYLATRSELASDSRQRFEASRCLIQHAQVLRDAVSESSNRSARPLGCA